MALEAAEAAEAAEAVAEATEAVALASASAMGNFIDFFYNKMAPILKLLPRQSVPLPIPSLTLLFSSTLFIIFLF